MTSIGIQSVGNLILIVGIGSTALVAFLSYRFPKFMAGLFTLCFAGLVAVIYNAWQHDYEAAQIARVLIDVDPTLPTPGCPPERPLGLNFRNLSNRTVTSVSWKISVTRKGATTDVASRSNKFKNMTRVMKPGVNIEICAAMPKLDEQVGLSDADFYPRPAHIQLAPDSSVIKDPSPLEKGFFPEDE